MTYVRYKRKTERYLMEEWADRRWPAIILRPGDVYGPFDRTSYALIFRGIEKVIPFIVGHGR